MNDQFDLVIAGGGMVGASLARALQLSGLRIAVVEAWPLSSGRQPSYDDRAIALSWGTRLILEAIGVWAALAPVAEPIRHIHVSDRGHFGFTRLEAREQGVEALGYVATGHSLGQALLGGLDQVPGVTLFCPAELRSFEIDGEQTIVHLSQGGESKELRCRLLVAADGVNSPIRQLLGIETSVWPYGQTALISNLTPDRPTPNVAYERFTGTGPMAMLPLPDNRWAMVWTLADDEVEEVLALEEGQFLERIQERFGTRMGRFVRAGARSVYPLRLLQAKEQFRPRVALVGNASHAVHPITGQGFNLGIRDVAVLADLLHDAARTGADPGDPALLARYADWRRRDQQAVALVTDGLVRLFTNPLPPLRLLRNLGLVALDLCPPARRELTHRFMGLGGRLPRLSRGLPLG